MFGCRSSRRGRSRASGGAPGLLAAGILVLAAVPPAAAADREFPEQRPASRAQAVAALSGAGALPSACLTPVVQSVALDGARHSSAARRALALLRGEIALPARVDRTDESGLRFRYTLDAASFDRIAEIDSDGNGWPDGIDAVRLGVASARARISGTLGLVEPANVTVTLGRIGFGISGYTVDRSGPDGGLAIVLDASPEVDLHALRLAAAHQFAHATIARALGDLPAEWGEAVAAWVEIPGGEPLPASTAGRLDLGLGALEGGFLESDAGAAAGLAAWVAFVDEGLGVAALRTTLEQIARGGPVAAALDRGLRLATGSGLDTALREFQLWALLAGDWDDGRHFSFAADLASPRFATAHAALPALVLGAEPGIKGTGSAVHLIEGLDRADGLTVRVEAEYGGVWEGDLLLAGPDGRLHRVAIELDADGRGELSVPVDGFDRAVLLVRNLSGSTEPRGYSWSAFLEKDYPFALLDLDAQTDAKGPATVVAWETSNERDLVGFNVLRTRLESGMTVRVNPVWIPAFGDAGEATSYRFVDSDADPGAAYAYRIEAITKTGLGRVTQAVLTGPMSIDR